MDIAKIGIEVNSKGLRRAATDLDKINRAMGGVERQSGGLNRGVSAADRALELMRRELDLNTRALRNTGGSADRAAGSISGLGRASSLAQRAVGLLGTALAALGTGSAISQMAGFEQTLSKVQAVTRASAEDMDNLTRAARQLGATTAFSASEAAEGMQFLGMAGFNTSQIIKAMPSTLALAKAGALDLGSAADIASNALSGFGLRAEQMGTVADTLAAAASRSNTNVQQLGEAMSYAAPFARALDVSIQEATAAIGVMSDAGVQASRAGTGLAGIFRQLTNVTNDGAAVLAGYGLTVADVNIKTHGLQKVLDTLGKTGMGTGEVIRLFGSEAGVAASVLLGATGRVGELTGELNAASGAAEEAARVMGDNLRGDLAILGSTISEVVLITNEQTGLTAKLRSMTQASIEAVGGFGRMIISGGQTAETLRAVAMGIGAVAVAYGSFSVATRAATIAQAAFNMVARLNPYVAIAAAALGAAAAIHSYVSAQERQASAAINMWGEAEKSAGGYAAAQARIGEHQRILNDLHKQEMEDQRELDALRAKGFKTWGRDATKAAELEEKINESRATRMKILDASARAEKAEAGRREQQAADQLKLDKLLVDQQELQQRATDASAAALAKLTDERAALTKKTRGLTDEEEWLNQLLKDGELLTRRMRTATEVYADEQQRLNELKATGAITDQTYQRALAETEKTLKNATERSSELGRQADPMAQAWENAINRIDGTFADLFRSAFNGFDDFTKQIKQTFKNLLAELAYAAVKNKIMISLGLTATGTANAAGIPGMGGGIPGLDGSGGMGDLFGYASKLQKAYSVLSTGWAAMSGGWASGGFGGALSATGSYIGSFFGGSGAAGSLAAGSTAAGYAPGALAGWAPGGASAAAGGAASGSAGLISSAGVNGASWGAIGVAGALGGLLGSTAGGHGSIGGSTGAAIGMAVGGPLGAFIGGVAGSLIGSFSAKWQKYISETRLDFTGDNVWGTTYEEYKRKRAWKTSYRRETNNVDPAMQSSLTDAYLDVRQGVGEMYKMLGVTVSDASIRGVQMARLTIAGGTSAAKAEQMISDWFNTLAGKMVTAVNASLNMASLKNLITSLYSVNPVLELMGVKLLNVSISGARAAERLLGVTGGMDGLSKHLDNFYDHLFTDAEKMENATKGLTKAMADIGYSVPGTREGFRDIIASLDMTKAHSQSTFNALMNLVPAFGQFMTATEQAADKIKQEAAELLAQKKNDVSQKFNAYLSQSQKLQIELMKLTGDEVGILAMQRQAELDAMDEALRPFQERVWALQDEQRAMVETIQAQVQFASSLEQVKQQLGGVFNSIDAWLDNRKASGSPEQAFTASRTQFEAQLALARGGDFNALQSLTQYADRYLNAASGMYASGPEAQRIEQEIIKALEGMKAISPYEFLADEIKTALQAQTEQLRERLQEVVIKSMPTDAALSATLTGQLVKVSEAQLTAAEVKSALTGIATDSEISRLIAAVDLNGDSIISASELAAAQTNSTLVGELAKSSAYIGGKQLTHAEVRSALSGKATDAEIQRLIATADKNADGVIAASELAAIKISSSLSAELADQLNILGDKQLTAAEVRAALAGKASNADIDRLISRVDSNGDGIITATELTTARVNALLPGINVGLSKLGSQIDTSMDGLIDFSEFKSAFEGMASDAELRKLFTMLDKNGDGTISLLDEVKKSSEEVDSNTSQLETEAKKQLAALKTNTDEMIRQTGQFVEINGTMSSLKDAILALTELQAEQAAIEAREKAMKERDKLVFEKQRQQEGVRAKAQASIDHVFNLANQYGVKLLGKGGGNASFNVGANGIDIDYQNIWGPNASAIKAFKAAANQILSDDVYGGNSALAKLAKEIAALEAQKFATGGAFTNGIVSRATSFPMGMMGEAGPEAIMPLANVGGSLGVRVAGNDSDNGEQLAELRKQNQMLQATIQVLQAGFNKLIEKTDEGNESLDDINRNSRLSGGIA